MPVKMPVTCEQYEWSTFPTCLRIGPPEYAYIYNLIEVKGNTWYKCDRGSDGAPTGHKLWMHNVNGSWEAFDAPNDDPTSEIVVQFRSNESVLAAGWHTWELVQSGDNGDFQTTIIN